MVTLMGRPLLGDEERGEEEHRDGEQEAISGRTAPADALLQFGDERVKLVCGRGRKQKTEETCEELIWMF